MVQFLSGMEFLAKVNPEERGYPTALPHFLFQLLLLYLFQLKGLQNSINLSV
jgi:hypothetical protein